MSRQKSTDRWTLQDYAQTLTVHQRVAACLRRPAAASAGVAIEETVSASGVTGARYAGLQTCGSVWECPICAERISRGRRDELERAIQQAKALRLHPSMLTLTVKHGRVHSLKHLLKRIGEAWAKMQKRSRWRTIIAQYGVVGNVRALEVKYGAHGWHPHFHVLLLAQVDGLRAYWAEIAALWQEVCQSVGVYAGAAGLDFRDGDEAVAGYVAKGWNMADELTRASAKDGDGQTPWQILHQAGEGSELHADLWREYAKAMHGRRQLRYSKGLRELLNVAEVSDEDLADDPVQVVAVHPIPAEIWSAVAEYGLRGDLLRHVVADGWDTTARWLESLPQRSHAGSPPGRAPGRQQ